MGKARGEGSRYFVIYSDVLKPLDFGGWPIERAFKVLLEQCRYVALWDVKQTATLEFRHKDGPHKHLPVGVISPVEHARTFSAEVLRGNNGEDAARRNIMLQVLRAGLNGWRGETRERFSSLHGIADDRRRYPERYPPNSE
jgi:hypothetical protein